MFNGAKHVVYNAEYFRMEMVSTKAFTKSKLYNFVTNYTMENILKMPEGLNMSLKFSIFFTQTKINSPL